MTPDPEDQLQQQLRKTHKQTLDALKSTIERLEARAEQQRMEREQRPQFAAGQHSFSRTLKGFFTEPRTWLEIAGLIVLGLYAYYAREQVRTMNEVLAEIKGQMPRIADSATAAKKSADIAFLQMKRLDAADLHFTTNFAYGRGLEGVWLNIENTGRATATKIQGTETVSIEELPSRRKIQPDVVLQLNAEALKPGIPGRVQPLRKVYAVSGLDPAVIRDIARLKKIVKLEGQFNYDDGFGDVIPSHFCWDVIGSDFEPGDSSRDIEASAGYKQYDCDSSENQLKAAIRERQIADSQASQ